MELKGQKLKEAERDVFLQTWQWSAIVWPLLLVVSAWGIIFVASTQQQLFWFNHDFLLQKSHFPWVIALIIFLVCWQVMILAMMLPSVLPLLFLMGERTLLCSQRWRQQALFMLGYALVWTAFGLAAFLGDTGIHGLVAHSSWLYLHAWIIGSVTLLCAGIFQFSPFKRQCLQRCCFPFDGYLLVMDQEKKTLYGRGMRYGAYCLGSCGALMLVLFGFGMGSLLWMALGMGIMMGEKVIAGRYYSVQVIGVALVLLACLWAVLPYELLSRL